MDAVCTDLYDGDDMTGKTHLEEVWPNIEVFFHGGVAFTPYREQYKRLITSPNMHYMETYNASEGFFGIQDDPDDKSMLLMLDYGVFYEFIPMDGGDPYGWGRSCTSLGSREGQELRYGDLNFMRPLAL